MDILVGIVNNVDSDDFGPTLLSFIATLLQKNAILKDINLLMEVFYFFKIKFYNIQNFKLIEKVLNKNFSNLRLRKNAESSILDLMRNVPELNNENLLNLAKRLPL